MKLCPCFCHIFSLYDIFTQTAQEVLSALRDGCFGDCDAEVEKFLESYRAIFPYATDFKLPSTSSDESATEVNDEVSKEAN